MVLEASQHTLTFTGNNKRPSLLLHPPEDMESEKCHLGAIIVRDLSISVSNYRSNQTLEEYCKKQDIVGIADIDTRALTKAGATRGGTRSGPQAVGHGTDNWQPGSAY